MNFFQIFSLNAFAIAQPLYSLLGANQVFFTAHGFGPLEVSLFVISLSFIFPGLIFAVELLIKKILGSKISLYFHRLIIYIYLLSLSAQLVNKLPINFTDFALINYPDLLVVAILSVILLVIFLKFKKIREYLSFLAIAGLVFPIIFIANNKIIFPQKTEDLGEIKIENPVPIFILIFDELPLNSLLDKDGNIDEVLFPNFNSLSDSFTWYKNATTVADSTVTSVPAILTGSYPKSKTLPSFDNYQKNLFNLLKEKYLIYADENFTNLCPTEICLSTHKQESNIYLMFFSDIFIVYEHIIYPKSIKDNLPQISNNWKDFSQDFDKVAENEISNIFVVNNKNEPRKEIFYSYLDAIKKSNDPQLFYHHDDLPHYPYEYLPSGKMYTRMSSDPGMSNEVWGNNQWIVIQNYQRHLLQVQFVDKMLGDFLSKIKSQGLFDQSMIVVLSDHGASFYTNDNRRSITGSNVQNIASVPFFIKKPYQQNGYIDEVSAETIDILPTILDVIGASSSHDFDGNSLFVDLPEVRKKAIYSQDATSIISLDEKIMKDKQRFFLKSKYTNKDEFSTDNEKIFKLGDYSEIINSDLNNFSIVQSNKYSISINSEFSFSSVDLNSSFIPADISGYIYESNENSDEEIDLAIAVNGKIRAITRTIQGVAWNSVVNENSFINGNNEIEIFRIINNDFSVTLDKLNHLLNDDYSIIIEDDQSFLMNNTSSNRFIFKTSALAGRVDVVKFDGINLEIRGWAADPLTKDRPKNILLFADNVLIGNVKPYLSRPDVAEYLINPQYTNSGYLLSYKFKEENINQPTYRVLVLCENGDVFEISR